METMFFLCALGDFDSCERDIGRSVKHVHHVQHCDIVLEYLLQIRVPTSSLPILVSHQVALSCCQVDKFMQGKYMH